MGKEDPGVSFDGDFDPAAYLESYYQDGAHSDEVQTYQWIVDVLKRENRRYPRMIEVGCGPTVHMVVPLIPYVGQVHMADYLPQNLAQIQKWLRKEPDAHDWSAHIRASLTVEGAGGPAAVRMRTRQMRQKITALRHVDLTQPLPLGDASRYPLVTAFYCAGSATSTKREWRQFMQGIFTLVEPGGLLLVTDFRNAQRYPVGDKEFPNAPIDEHDVAQVLKDSRLFDKANIHIDVKSIAEGQQIGIHEFILASAIRKS